MVGDEKRVSLGLPAVKYMTTKWFEERLELMGHVINLSRIECQEWLDWYSEQSNIYGRMEKEIYERANWMDERRI